MPSTTQYESFLPAGVPGLGDVLDHCRMFGSGSTDLATLERAYDDAANSGVFAGLVRRLLREAIDQECSVDHILSLTSSSLFIFARQNVVLKLQLFDAHVTPKTIQTTLGRTRFHALSDRSQGRIRVFAQADGNCIEQVDDVQLKNGVPCEVDKDQGFLIEFNCPTLATLLITDVGPSITLYHPETRQFVGEMPVQPSITRWQLMCGVLGKMKDPRTVNYFRALIEHPDPLVRWSAAQGAFKQDVGLGLKILKKFLEDADDRIRKKAATEQRRISSILKRRNEGS